MLLPGFDPQFFQVDPAFVREMPQVHKEITQERPDIRLFDNRLLGIAFDGPHCPSCARDIQASKLLHRSSI